jgi:HD-GYP domain-containing protein (c-di-GMP phosphodiesterase class II)
MSGRAAGSAGGPHVLARPRRELLSATRLSDRGPPPPDEGMNGPILLVLLATVLATIAIAGATRLQRGGVVQPLDPVSLMLVLLAAAVLAAGIGLVFRQAGRAMRAAPSPAASRRAARRTRSIGRYPPAYDSLVRLSDRLARATAMEAVLSAVAEEAALAVRTPVAVFLIERSGKRLFLAGAHGIPEAVRRVWPAVAVEGMDRLFEGQRLTVIGEVSTSQVPDREIHAAIGVRSAAFVRLEHRGAGLGVIAALSLDEPRTFATHDLVALRSIADQASHAIEVAWQTARSERRQRLMHGLQAIDRATAGRMSAPETLTVILDEVIRLLHADAATVLRLDASGQVLRVAATRGFRTTHETALDVRIRSDRVGLAVVEKRPIRIADLGIGAPDMTRTWLSHEEGLVCGVAFPLPSNGAVEGVLEVFHRSSFEPDDEWWECAEAITVRAALAMENASVLERLRLANDHLLSASDRALEGWSCALELRDHETEGHTRRVTRLTLELAAAAGIEGDDLVCARRGAILHDIGTMAVPESILQKPGSLTVEEWRIVRRHPRLALEMLEPMPFLGSAIDIPLCHHERWDGTGYPRGLSGEAIPLAARLFAVADVWDSLRSDRPYRGAWPSAEARECIRALAGTHFDPRVVDLFERLHAA